MSAWKEDEAVTTVMDVDADTDRHRAAVAAVVDMIVCHSVVSTPPPPAAVAAFVYAWTMIVRYCATRPSASSLQHATSAHFLAGAVAVVAAAVSVSVEVVVSLYQCVQSTLSHAVVLLLAAVPSVAALSAVCYVRVVL